MVPRFTPHLHTILFITFTPPTHTIFTTSYSHPPLHTSSSQGATPVELYGVAIFVAIASLAHALIAVTLGPSFPVLLKTVYEPKFFEAHLSLSDKITAWRTQPVASLQLMTIVLLLSVMAVVTASVG